MRKKPGKQVKAAGILLMHLTDASREFLLMRHRDRWDLPKGHCEPGESFREAALREVQEETGIESDLIQLDPQFTFDIVYPVTYQRWGDEVFEKQVRYFLGYLRRKPSLKITEHESAMWFPWHPPHRIQQQTIDPLLAAVAKYFAEPS